MPKLTLLVKQFVARFGPSLGLATCMVRFLFIIHVQVLIMFLHFPVHFTSIMLDVGLLMLSCTREILFKIPFSVSRGLCPCACPMWCNMPQLGSYDMMMILAFVFSVFSMNLFNSTYSIVRCHDAVDNYRWNRQWLYNAWACTVMPCSLLIKYVLYCGSISQG